MHVKGAFEGNEYNTRILQAMHAHVFLEQSEGDMIRWNVGKRRNVIKNIVHLG